MGGDGAKVAASGANVLEGTWLEPEEEPPPPTAGVGSSSDEGEGTSATPAAGTCGACRRAWGRHDQTLMPMQRRRKLQHRTAAFGKKSQSRSENCGAQFSAAAHQVGPRNAHRQVLLRPVFVVACSSGLGRMLLFFCCWRRLRCAEKRF